jgi:hypothetical protein
MVQFGFVEDPEGEAESVLHGDRGDPDLGRCDIMAVDEDGTIPACLHAPGPVVKFRQGGIVDPILAP